MATTAFVGVQWQPLDLIDDAKMSQMANGIQFVADNTPRVRYNTGGKTARQQGVRIASGRVTIPRNTKRASASKRVNFGGFFSPGCQPQITTGIMSPVQQNIYCTFRGQTRLEPDHNGMIIDIEIGEKDKEKSKIGRTFAVHWVALGY